MRPKISIITPLFNKAPYFKETIQSVLVQTFSDWEWIVVDNNSTDGGPDLLKEWEDSRIQLIHQKEKQGPAATRNAGLNVASGEWILFLDADDLMEDQHLEQLIKAEEKKGEVTLIVGGWKQFKELSNESDSKMDTHWPAGKDEEELALIDLTIGFAPWAVHAAIIRRESCPSWPEELDDAMAEDIVFWFRAIKKRKENQVSYIENCGALYRIQTVDGRSPRKDVSKWFHGVNQAILFNLQEWEKGNQDVTRKQCETLMRVYTDLYRQAVENQEKEIAKEALAQANHWLDLRIYYGKEVSLGMWLRKGFGIAICEKFRNWYGGYSRTQANSFNRSEVHG